MEPYHTLDQLTWHRRLWFIIWSWTIVGPIGLSTALIETVEELQELAASIAGAADEPSDEAEQCQLAYLLAERSERLRPIYLNRLRVCLVLFWPLAALCWLALMLKGAIPPLVRAGGWLPLTAAWLAGERWLVRPLAYQWNVDATLTHNRERETRIHARLQRSVNQLDDATRLNGEE